MAATASVAEETHKTPDTEEQGSNGPEATSFRIGLLKSRPRNKRKRKGNAASVAATAAVISSPTAAIPVLSSPKILFGAPQESILGEITDARLLVQEITTFLQPRRLLQELRKRLSKQSIRHLPSCHGFLVVFKNCTPTHVSTTTRHRRARDTESDGQGESGTSKNDESDSDNGTCTGSVVLNQKKKRTEKTANDKTGTSSPSSLSSILEEDGGSTVHAGTVTAAVSQNDEREREECLGFEENEETSMFTRALFEVLSDTVNMCRCSFLKRMTASLFTSKQLTSVDRSRLPSFLLKEGHWHLEPEKDWLLVVHSKDLQSASLPTSPSPLSPFLSVTAVASKGRK